MLYESLGKLYRSSIRGGTRKEREIDHIFTSMRQTSQPDLIPEVYLSGEQHKGLPDHKPIVVEIDIERVVVRLKVPCSKTVRHITAELIKSRGTSFAEAYQ